MVWGIRGVAGVVVVLGLVSACGGSGSEGEAGGRSGEPEEVTVVQREGLGRGPGFDVAVGEGKGWLLVRGDPAVVWEIAGDGTLTRRAELAEADGIAAFGDGAAVTRLRCTDETDDECGSPVADLLLLAPDGAVDHELTLVESDAGGLEYTRMRILGASDDQIWVETDIAGTGLFAVSRSGEVETIPPARRREFANDRTCAVGGVLLTVRVHSDLYDPELGPPDTGVVISAGTPIRTTVALEAFTGGEWQPVEGSERTFDLLGDEARPVCEGDAIGVEGARWTPDGGWSAAPARRAEPQFGSVAVGGGCEDCAWAPGLDASGP